jgi:diacylglycerol kinase family enzyme
VTRVALLANEGSGTGCDPGDLERLLTRHGASVTVFPFEDVRQAAATRPDRLAVAGGDGSIAAAAAAAGEVGAALAVIPSGTANDFARGAGLPVDPEEACRLAATGTEERVRELARMDGRPFVNVASAGLAAGAARAAAPHKRRLGVLAYVIGAARAGLTGHAVPSRLRADGHEVFDGPAWQVIVSSSGRFGAGSSVAAADPSDGRLDATVIEAGSRARLVVHAYGLRSGHIASQRGVRHVRGGALELDVPEGTDFNVDGEILTHGPARFTVQADAFRLVVG